MKFICKRLQFFQEFLIMNTFEEKFQCIAADDKSIFDFSSFCNELHDHIKWKQEKWDSKMFANFLLVFLDTPNAIFNEQKNNIFLCKNFKFEFLLLYELFKMKVYYEIFFQRVFWKLFGNYFFRGAIVKF